MVESESDEILRDAEKEDVAFLVVGDPYGYALFLISYPALSLLGTSVADSNAGQPPTRISLSARAPSKSLRGQSPMLQS